MNKTGRSKTARDTRGILSGGAGRDAFLGFYAGLFGGRWRPLCDALSREERKTPYTDSLLKPYYLSAASIAVAAALDVRGAADILDMCAAPGGKTVVLATLMDRDAKLTANEFSRARRSRLRRVVEEHLPADRAAAVTVSGYDGARWSRYARSCFDRILLDAPCSSERHVLSDESALSLWTPARIKNLAVKQWSMLSGAWLLLRSGGRLVYSTCALSRHENDCIVEKLLGKYPDAEVRLPGEAFFSGNPLLSEIQPEYGLFGVRILPDTSRGAGPMFFSVVCKRG